MDFDRRAIGAFEGPEAANARKTQAIGVQKRPGKLSGADNSNLKARRATSPRNVAQDPARNVAAQAQNNFFYTT